MKPSIPQGTRDFSPEVVRKRQYILSILRNIFELYGFQPLETPAMENLTTLTGKYGEEGDRLIFKILNNGLHEKNESDKEKLNSEWSKLLTKPYTTPIVTERALRYDLTIPFARYVVMHQNDLAIPFRRYQMQPVWRADRPQKGRYREFWQCDADVVGSTSLINEAELLSIYANAFSQLGLPVAIKINSRKVLQGLAEVCGNADKMMDITIALDKIDKIGWSGVAKELSERGINDTGINTIRQITEVSGTNTNQLSQLRTLMGTSPAGTAGIEEIEQTLLHYTNLGGEGNVIVDVSLARGLNYYTGIIVEVVCTHPDVKMGSIGGGGRYDDLTGLFGLKGLSGVGVSFGIDRIYDILDELNLFPKQIATGTRAIILNFGGENQTYAMRILSQLRNAGIATELYPDTAKFDKQMKYANKRGLPFVLIPGDDERVANKISIKNFITGQQQIVTISEAIELLQI